MKIRLNEEQNVNDYFETLLRALRDEYNHLQQVDPQLEFSNSLYQYIQGINLFKVKLNTKKQSIQNKRKRDEIINWVLKTFRFIVVHEIHNFLESPTYIHHSEILSSQFKEKITRLNHKFFPGAEITNEIDWTDSASLHSNLLLTNLISDHFIALINQVEEFAVVPWIGSPRFMLRTLYETERQWKEREQEARNIAQNWSKYPRLMPEIKLGDRSFVWIDMQTNQCPEEADMAGHCATGRAGSVLWSCREIIQRDKHGHPLSWKTRATLEFCEGGLIGEWKGARNSDIAKQNPELIPVMMKVLDLPQVFGFADSLYMTEVDFRPWKAGKELCTKLFEDKPEIFEWWSVIKLFGPDVTAQRILNHRLEFDLTIANTNLIHQVGIADDLRMMLLSNKNLARKTAKDSHYDIDHEADEVILQEFDHLETMIESIIGPRNRNYHNGIFDCIDIVRDADMSSMVTPYEEYIVDTKKYAIKWFENFRAKSYHLLDYVNIKYPDNTFDDTKIKALIDFLWKNDDIIKEEIKRSLYEGYGYKLYDVIKEEVEAVVFEPGCKYFGYPLTIDYNGDVEDGPYEMRISLDNWVMSLCDPKRQYITGISNTGFFISTSYNFGNEIDEKTAEKYFWANTKFYDTIDAADAL